MFYSHEILTSQRHGVATVWLVATLGQKSTSKKINRKAILGVDVPRACDTIMSPEAPMALRLQGNLLYGVTKVYSRQCVYTLADVQAMLDKMKIALKVVHGRGLQVDAGKARPEELVVPYDPAFIPDFRISDLDFELLNNLGSTAQAAVFESSLCSSDMSRTPDSQKGAFSLPQLDIDDTSGDALINYGAFSTASGSADSSESHHLLDRLQRDGEEGVILQPDFDFDEDGNIIDLVLSDAPPVLPPATPVTGEAGHASTATVLHDEQEFVDVLNPVFDITDGLQSNEQEEHEKQSPTWGRLPDPDYVEESTGHNARLHRKQRSQKLVQKDVLTQISRDELLDWDQQYLQIMSRLDFRKSNAKSSVQARKNAVSWIFGHGIGGIGTVTSFDGASHPLESFCGDALLTALSDCLPAPTATRKRSSSESVSGDEELHRRNLRRRLSDDGLEMGMTLGTDHDMQEDIELGLDAPPSLPDDASSQMPWNTTASLKGSLVGSSSVTRPFDGLEGSSQRFQRGFGRAGSRFSSASPLARRGLPRDLFSHESLSNLSLGDFGEFHDNDLEDLHREGRLGDSVEHLQEEAVDSQLSIASLDNNDKNFLDFLQKRVPRSAAGDEAVTFSELLPPSSTSRPVATQALLHVLTLATKNVIQVSQGRRCGGAPYIIEDLDEIRLIIKY